MIVPTKSIVDAAEGLVAMVLLAYGAGAFLALMQRGQVVTMYWLSKHRKDAKAFIILSGHSDAVRAAQDVVVTVLNEVEKEQAVDRAGIGINDKPTSTPPENAPVPTQDKPTGWQEERQ